MPTVKQKQALGKTVEFGGNITRAMREVGYSEATVNNPSNLTKSKGYKELLHEYGLTENLVVTALVDDINKKKSRRLGELSLGAELLGMRKMGPIIANQINIEETKTQHEEETPEQLQRMKEYAIVYEKYLYAKLSDKTSVTIEISKDATVHR